MEINEIQKSGVLLDEGIFNDFVVKKYFLNDVIYMLIKKDNWEKFDIRKPCSSDIERFEKVKISNRYNVVTSTIKKELEEQLNKIGIVELVEKDNGLYYNFYPEQLIHDNAFYICLDIAAIVNEVPSGSPFKFELGWYSDAGFVNTVENLKKFIEVFRDTAFSFKFERILVDQHPEWERYALNLLPQRFSNIEQLVTEVNKLISKFKTIETMNIIV